MPFFLHFEQRLGMLIISPLCLRPSQPQSTQLTLTVFVSRISGTVVFLLRAWAFAGPGDRLAAESASLLWSPDRFLHRRSRALASL